MRPTPIQPSGLAALKRRKRRAPRTFQSRTGPGQLDVPVKTLDWSAVFPELIIRVIQTALFLTQGRGGMVQRMRFKGEFYPDNYGVLRK